MLIRRVSVRGVEAGPRWNSNEALLRCDVGSVGIAGRLTDDRAGPRAPRLWESVPVGSDLVVEMWAEGIGRPPVHVESRVDVTPLSGTEGSIFTLSGVVTMALSGGHVLLATSLPEPILVMWREAGHAFTVGDAIEFAGVFEMRIP